VLKEHLGSSEHPDFPYPGLAEELLHPNNRLCVPLLIILQKYLGSNGPVIINLSLIQLLIDMTEAKQCHVCPFQILIEAFRVLKAISASDPQVCEYLGRCRSSYPYPRIKSLLRE
jgi:hypothetical protein